MSAGCLDTAVQLDCLRCGACCLMAGETPGDPDLRCLSRVATSISEVESWEAAEISLEARCTALHGEIGKAVWCAIYERRPNVCREFAAGSPSCLAARADAGLL